ncbi:hypothetical protein BCR39DRAFT_544383 [Naematelia encephala]|uniref:Homeobox domain-containing protein n=1 Tax=Naematelia encephala TaxID=71784 RepID=A0A1Y2AS95_9TREE|nr:hypothetical protein BCR39DRAFT_544383 [Naematelia encephala]
MSTKDDTLQEHQGPQDAANLADEFPSPEPHHAAPIDMSHELANQAAAQAIEAAVAHAAQDNDDPSTFAHHHHHHHHQHQHTTASSPTPPPPPARFHESTPQGALTNNEQIAILRESYARNPNPGKAELETLAIKTGRPWNKIREYFRQRRNKLRGLDDLAVMEEPGRATGWLQVTYRSAPTTSFVSQLNLYEAYKDRFDPYSTSTPLLGGQELIALACATFPGCEMAKDESDYVLRGLREKDGAEREAWERGMEGLVEPLRGSSWLLSHYQHPTDPSAPATLTQTELYTSYATRFSSLLPQPEPSTSDFDTAPGGTSSTDLSEQDLETLFSSAHPQQPQQSPQQQQNQAQEQEQAQISPRENRLLNPVELINLARMTFPKCEPVVDEQGRFVIRGLERRDWVERGRHVRPDDMFPFALANGMFSLSSLSSLLFSRVKDTKRHYF